MKLEFSNSSTIHIYEDHSHMLLPVWHALHVSVQRTDVCELPASVKPATRLYISDGNTHLRTSKQRSLTVEMTAHITDGSIRGYEML